MTKQNTNKQTNRLWMCAVELKTDSKRERVRDWGRSLDTVFWDYWTYAPSTLNRDVRARTSLLWAVGQQIHTLLQLFVSWKRNLLPSWPSPFFSFSPSFRKREQWTTNCIDEAKHTSQLEKVLPKACDLPSKFYKHFIFWNFKEVFFKSIPKPAKV